MTDQSQTTSADPVADAVAAPVVAPIADVAPTPAPVVEPTAPAPVPADDPAPTSLLGDALVSPPIAPVEPAPAPETPQAEAPTADPAPPPTYEPFQLPDGLTVDAEKIGNFTGLLGEFEGTTKADHAAVQAFGQKLVDYHTAEVQRIIGEVQKSHTSQIETQRDEWRKQFVADPEIGGNRQNTTVESAVNFIRTHGGSDEQQAELRDLMDKSGVGNHPAMIRLLAKAGMAMSEGRPLAASRPALPPQSKTQKLYGRTG